MRDLKRMSTKDPAVYVGIREQDGSEIIEGGDITLAGIGAVHEFGTDRAGPNNSTVIPSRSFLRSEVDQRARLYGDELRKAVGKVIDGGNLERELRVVGVLAASNVRRRIRAGIAPELAESTVERKGSSKPLIDTGRLIGSISFEVTT